MEKSILLKRANENLSKIFGERHDKPLTESCIESVYSRNLFSIESDAKTRKGSKAGYMTGILYLAPAKVSGISTCGFASKGCAEACLFTAGRGVMYSVFRARVLKTLALFADRPRFIESIQESIRKLTVKASNRNMVPVVRLNGTSDLVWESMSSIIQDNSEIQFYDYTKNFNRFNRPVPKNYDLTFSRSESNESAIESVLSKGGRVAVVFDEIPKTWKGFKVIDGDETDLRFLDRSGVIVGLKAKGDALKDSSGFVVKIIESNISMTGKAVA